MVSRFIKFARSFNQGQIKRFCNRASFVINCFPVLFRTDYMYLHQGKKAAIEWRFNNVIHNI